jgi:micrococcal nuclease
MLRRLIEHRLPVVLALAALVAGMASCTAETPAAGKTPGATKAGAGIATLRPAPTPHACAPPYPAGAPGPQTVFCADPSRMQPARVLRVVDGDTIHVEIDGRDETVRFYGIDTTERGEACFDEATERTAALAGDEVRLLPDARGRDRYGRLLRYVYSPAGLSIDAEMVAEGLAHAWRQDGALRAPIIVLEDDAKAARLGCLWR